MNNCVLAKFRYKQILMIIVCDWCPDLLTSLRAARSISSGSSDVHLESVLDLVENLGVGLVAGKR